MKITKEEIVKLKNEKEKLLREELEKRQKEDEAVEFEIQQKAHKGYTATYTLPHPKNDLIKPIDYLFSNVAKIEKILTKELDQHKGIKFSIKLTAQYEKMNGPEEFQEDEMVGQSKSLTIISPDFIRKQIEDAFTQIMNQLDNETNKGSGWKFKKINQLSVNTSAYQPLNGKSWIDLPAKLKAKKAIINVKNNDNECHRWAILSAIRPVEVHPERVSNYKQYKDHLNYTGLTFPISIDHHTKFEQLNPTISVNIFGYDKEQKLVYPLYISDKHAALYNIDLLLIYDDNNRHYCWIKDFNKLMADYSDNNRRKHFCRFCLHAFSREDLLTEHKPRCATFGIQRTTLPTEENNILKFTNYQKGLPCPFVIYCDFESILVNTGLVKKEERTLAFMGNPLFIADRIVWRSSMRLSTKRNNEFNK